EGQGGVGGAGYCEASLLARRYGQAPLNASGEGGGSIQYLAGLRALAREPETGAAVLAELDAAADSDGDFDAALAALRGTLSATPPEAGARHLVERMALLLQASVLLRAGSPVAGGFCRSRLGGAHGAAFGTLPADIAFDGLIARATGG